MAQQWEISEPKLLDVGGADERVAALSVALIGGHVDVVTHDDTGAASICRSVITMGHALGMTVLAEGVETPEQAASLQGDGCDAFQGYLFGRPMPVDDATGLLRQRDSVSASSPR